MKKTLLGALALCLLCGCSAVKDPESLAASVQEGYAASTRIQTEAVVQTDTSEEHMEYQLKVDYENAEMPQATIELLAPESIAGITAAYSGEENTLSYDDTVLQTMLPERKGLTPVDAVPAVFNSVITQQPSSVWTEADDLLVLEYREDTEECTVVREVYLSQTDGSMREARIFCNGTQIISCSFQNFMIDKG